MSKIKGYRTSFQKKDGSIREMSFIRLTDMPLNRVPAPAPAKPGAKKRAPRQLAEGAELVWDIEAGGLRTINWTRTMGEKIEIEIREEHLPPIQPGA